MPQHYVDSAMEVRKTPEMGPIGNNGYLIRCKETGDAVIIDAPAEPEKLLAEIGDATIKAIIITHRHGDHTAGLEEIKSATQAPVASHPEDATAIPMPPDMVLRDGDILEVGKVALKIIHTPGHTPGAICILAGDRLFSGDTLFPGGPGRTASHDNFLQIKSSITQKLMPLSDSVAVYPGHGDDTTIGSARGEIGDFDSRSHSPELCGDVQWLRD